MELYKSIARNLLNIAKYIKAGEMALTDVPFENIMEIIRDLYHAKMGNGELLCDLYTTLLTKGLERGDREEVVTVLTLLAQHMVVFASDEIRLNKLADKNYLLQSRAAYWFNCDKVRKWHENNGGENNDGENQVPFEGRGVVYSAVIGNYDEIKEPQYVNPELDYILFTDNPEVTSSVWQVRLVDKDEQLDNVRLARRIKILGHEYLSGYDYSIWVDGKLSITDNIREYIENYRRLEPMLVFNHYVNDCIYQEKAACVSLQKDNPEVMEKQIQKYLTEGYPAHNGLVDSACLVRELKNKRVQQVMETWWNEILQGSRRDQLSFNYACWKNQFVYDSTDLFIYGNKYIQTFGHNS